ncbi:CMRF35-like molecule 1 isoform X7 [Diceros bicornis minor]|uniref:CMRF35-like molecule 1 isoform X7 n=1 Tax=Diceros bicornis minor TaxID=77932 RepID=UPI0026F1AD2F|nr:CMRF35-like molecule 1 isoform X7 [Diceros bicornis minor]
MHLLLLLPLLFWLSGSTAIRGPKAVSGLERGSLTAQCRYGQGWETYKKWWCRGADWNLCRILVKTTGSEQKVKQGRVSIMDNQRDHVFTVTMEELRQDDADTYWCGIERTGADLGDKVKVTIDPAPTTASTTTSTTTTTTTTTTTVSTAPVTPEETQVSPTLTSYHSDSSSWDIPRAAPGERPLLCKPDPAADRNLSPPLPEEVLQKAQFLCPGGPGGSGIRHHGSLSNGGHFLCGSILGHLGTGTNLQQHEPPHHPHPQQEP